MRRSWSGLSRLTHLPAMHSATGRDRPASARRAAMRPSNSCEQAASASSGEQGESAHPPQIVGTSLQTNRRRD